MRYRERRLVQFRIHPAADRGARFLPRPHRSSQRATSRKVAPASSAPQAKTAATLAETLQRPPARSRNSSRAKSSQLRLSRRKRLRAVRLPRMGAPTAPAAGQPIPDQRCHTWWRPLILQDLLRDPVSSQRAGQSSAADLPGRTARVWLPPPSHLPKRTAQAADITPACLHQWLYGSSYVGAPVESGLELRFRRCEQRYPDPLNSDQPIIRRADLGAAGIYYGAALSVPLRRRKRRQRCKAD